MLLSRDVEGEVLLNRGRGSASVIIVAAVDLDD